jgi:S1-C subfamily serine protease
MNTAIVSPSGSYAGIGFAVPVDTINRIVPQLIRNGVVKKPGLGIQVLESDLLRGNGIVGGIVANVLRGSPADKAGLSPLGRDTNGKIQLGDVIVAVDDKPITDGDDLLNILDEKQPGDKLRMKVVNNGTERTVTVTLGLLQE